MDMKFDRIVCQRVVFNHPELSQAFYEYLDSFKKKGVDDLGFSAMKKVFAIHIRPYKHRMEWYKREYLIEYPESTPASVAIEELVKRYGWRVFLEGMCIFIKQRTRIMPSLGFKLSNVKDIQTKVMSLKTVVK